MKKFLFLLLPLFGQAGDFPFEPLAADPKWPAMSASRVVMDDETDNLETAGVTRIGGTGQILDFNTIRFGFQALVNSTFDFDSSDFTLINNDFYFALPVAYVDGDFTAMFRITHLSSHAGDEFIAMGNPRLPYDFETFDLLMSQKYRDTRLYGGGAYTFRKDENLQDDIDKFKLQLGVEQDFRISSLKPIKAALDLQYHFRDSGNYLDIGANVSYPISEEFKLTLDGFHGKNYFGQFPGQDLSYWGFGLRYDF